MSSVNDGNITKEPSDGGGTSSFELGYLDGVTSAIQGQLDGKAASGHNHSLISLSDWPAGLTLLELGYLDG